MAEQEKLNGADTICHLIGVLTWWHDAALFPVFFYLTKSVDPIYCLHTLLLVLPVPYITSNTSQFKSTKALFIHARTRLAFKATSDVC